MSDAVGVNVFSATRGNPSSWICAPTFVLTEHAIPLPACIGPNFGFIKQLINYEQSLFGRTSVSFIDTSLGSVPDIYLSMDSNSPRRRVIESSSPMTINYKPINRTQSSNHRLSLSSRPVSSSWLFNSTSDDNFNSSFLHQPSSRFYSSSLRPMEPFGESSSYRSRMDRYFPRYYFP